MIKVGQLTRKELESKIIRLGDNGLDAEGIVERLITDEDWGDNTHIEKAANWVSEVLWAEQDARSIYNAAELGALIDAAELRIRNR